MISSSSAPPGTGKSQTIANMIAHCLGQGKSVLFVAEKSAALDVVHRRLCSYGLGESCLELHSNKSDRKSVMTQLGAAWDRATEGSDAEWIKVTGDLQVHRDQLNAYVEALHAPGSHGVTVFQAIGETASGAADFALSYAAVDSHDPQSFDDLVDLAGRIGRTHAATSDCTAFADIVQEDWSNAWQEQVFQAVGAVSASLTTLRETAAPLTRELGLPDDPDLTRERLATLANFAAVTGRTASADYRVALDAHFNDLAGGMDGLETSIKAVRTERTRLSARYTDDDITRIPLDDLDRDWREAGAKTWPLSSFAKKRVTKLLQSYAEGGTANPETDIAPLRALRSQLQAIGNSPLKMVPVFRGERTDLSQIRQYMTDAGDLRRAVGDLTRMATDTARMGERMSHLIEAGGDQAPLARHAGAFDEAHTRYATVLTALTNAMGVAPRGGSVAELEHSLTAMQAQRTKLSDWTRWTTLRREATGRGLGPLAEALETGGVIDDPKRAFRRAYFRWWLPLAMDASPVLRGFAHWEHADRIATFRILDERARALSSAQVRRAVMHDLPAQDGVPRKSELGTLKHQLGLQRPSISIRELIGKMPGTFTKLTPCVLMSPLSIAQYLPAEQAHFDIVIFDEASQITTWDAIGAIARGKQSIIVGDPKQLPPTNFFGRASSEEDSELESYEQDLPSILDEASTAGLPTHQLNWHYRSRDEALIAFSNHHYYGNRLVTFPSPSTGSDALVFHKIDGIYAKGEGRFNEAEAKAIAAYAVARLTAWLALPEDQRQTLGVITFNIQQQETILDLLDQARRDNPALEWFFEDDREEAVIVKNLENIQGDERDVMLFSITFGPDKAGKMSMNFGALNRDGGEKRLNVAVTRARGELHIFSSITADRIDLSRTKAVGVKHLKNFLDYAERGAVALPGMDEGSLGEAENPFEASIADALRAKGWDVRTQIGVSGFRIDLGVVHPDRAGAYLAGVECDGATYHSSATARDRDAIREAVLRNLGWEILRIWSTDWFRNPAETCDRTDAALRELLETSRHRIAEEDAARKAEAIAREAVEAALCAATPVVVDPVVEKAPTGEVIAMPDRASLPPAVAPVIIPQEPQRVADMQPAALPAPTDITPDADRFFDTNYTSVLTQMIATIVAEEAPLTVTLVVRQVAKAHGWQRAGGRIRERVLDCIGTAEIHDAEETPFLWAQGTHAPTIPFRPALNRTARDIPREEIAGLIAANPGLVTSPDSARALAGLMGINRLTADTRAYLESCLRTVGGV